MDADVAAAAIKMSKWRLKLMLNFKYRLLHYVNRWGPVTVKMHLMSESLIQEIRSKTPDESLHSFISTDFLYRLGLWIIFNNTYFLNRLIYNILDIYK